VEILGIRGIPARHGGFETFAERCALHLARLGWAVSVYCQEEGEGDPREEMWQGIRLVTIPVKGSGTASTIIFDAKCTLHAGRTDAVKLVLGYATAIFGIWYRCRGRVQVMNMDGLEWKRAKWGWAARTWLYLNERLGCLLGNHLIADHPVIADHLHRRVSRDKVTMIPYGADRVDGAPAEPLKDLGITPRRYALLIGRPEPENSLLEIVAAFSRRDRGMDLVVLGRLTPETNAYHRRVMDAAGPRVVFPGAIYDSRVVSALRYHCSLYVHGHQVGGTNPSLVEALGAGSPVLAHDNPYNRWVAGGQAAYFADEDACAAAFDELLSSPDRLDRMREGSYHRHAERFGWERVLTEYQVLLERHQRA
jgi:glycosyltransferase involved in cell wall biosynthesis